MPQQDPFAQFVVQAPQDDPFAQFLARDSAPQAPEPSTIDRILADNPALDPRLRATAGLLRFAKANPTEAGAMAGGMLAAPLTGGTSMLPVMAASGLGAAGGAGIGTAIEQLASGEAQDPDAVVGEMVGHGVAGAAYGAIPGLAGGALRLARAGGRGLGVAADLAGMAGVPGANAVGTALRILGRAKPAAAAAPRIPSGGRIVGRGQSFDDVAREALEELRQAPKAASVELPPPAAQPAVSYPRVAPPAATSPAPARIVRATKPTAGRGAPKADAPKATAKAAPAEPAALPEAWKPFVQTAGREAPTAPLGLSDDMPMWSRPAPAENVAREMRGALGAEDAGALMGMSADEVRAAAGGPKRIPAVARLADLDLNYKRLISDPRAGIALSAVPGAELFRRALLGLLSKDGAQQQQ